MAESSIEGARPPRRLSVPVRSPARLLAAALVALVLLSARPARAGAAGAREASAQRYWPSPALAAPRAGDRHFWARREIRWALAQGWLHRGRRFGLSDLATRAAAARVLLLAERLRSGGPGPGRDPYARAVAAGWIAPGSGPDDTITQLGFDRGVVRMLGLAAAAHRYASLRTADGYRPPLPPGFGAEQLVRHLGVRVNAPQGSDLWEWWPRQRLRREELAVEAYQLARLPDWSVDWAAAQASVAAELPAWTPLQRQVLAYALRYAGAPYVWGGTSDRAQVLFGEPAAGGFDCSGFVWWVLRLHSYTLADGSPWNAAAAIAGRTTYQMAADLPRRRRVAVSRLRPGEVLFWSDVAPRGRRTSWRHIFHTGIYLGGGWAIDSHGGGDGVTLDSVAPGAGWFHDHLAFGWRVLPRGQ